MTLLSERFVRTFQKAISTEMDAVRQRLGPFEVPVAKGGTLLRLVRRFRRVLKYAYRPELRDR